MTVTTTLPLAEFLELVRKAGLDPYKLADVQCKLPLAEFQAIYEQAHKSKNGP